MLHCTSLTFLLTLLGLLLFQISADLGGMSSPDNGKHVEETEGQLEPSLDIKSAECKVYPMTGHYTVIADFRNWDPGQDAKAVEFERCLQEKCGKDNFHGFWWKKFPPDTRFLFHVPYPVRDRMTDMYKLISDAIYEYSGDAKIRTTVYHA